jgi:hypothetical protein
MKYKNMSEETLKAAVFKDYFGEKKFSYCPNVDNIDFVVLGNTNIPILWAEGKLATGSWTTIATRTTSSGSYSLSPYRSYIQPSYATDATLGQIAYLVWIRVSGKNSAGWGATCSIFFDTLLIDVYVEN